MNDSFNNDFFIIDMEYDKGKCTHAGDNNKVPEILNFSIIKCHGKDCSIVNKFNYKIKPEKKLTAHIKQFLNVKDENYSDGLSQEEFVRKLNEDIGDDLIKGCVAYCAGDDDTRVLALWFERYLLSHPEIKTTEDCPCVILSDYRSGRIQNITEQISLMLTYKNDYLIYGNMDISVSILADLFNVECSDITRHNSESDAELLRRVIKSFLEFFTGSYVDVKNFSWENEERTQNALKKQTQLCNQHKAFIEEKFKKWVLTLLPEDINWELLGIPTDEFNEPLGIGEINSGARYWRGAYKKPWYAVEYEDWTWWCINRQKQSVS